MITDLRKTRVFQEAMEEGREKGRVEGREVGWGTAMEKVALELLRDRQSVAKIQKITGLPQARIRALKKKGPQASDE